MSHLRWVEWKNPNPARDARSEECALAQLLESVPELLLRVHHDRAVPGDGLLERLSRRGFI
jgi:hypothetical protein